MEHWCEDKFGSLTLGEPDFSMSNKVHILILTLKDMLSVVYVCLQKSDPQSTNTYARVLGSHNVESMVYSMSNSNFFYSLSFVPCAATCSHRIAFAGIYEDQRA